MLTRNQIKPLMLLTTGVVALLGGAIARAQTIDAAFGDIKVRAAALSDSVFRISLNSKGDAVPRQSVYLDPSRKEAPVGQTTTDGTRRTIQTSAGKLQIDSKAETYSLLNAKGELLLPPAPLAEQIQLDNRPALGLHIGWPAGRPFKIYGCGNGADTLLQHEIKTAVGNGRAIEPFFWSPTGVATFVVGEDENAPAKCDGQIESGHVTWRVRGSAADLYLMIAPTLEDASKALLDLTGRPPVPPRWTFGYLQSRWGWKDRSYIDDTLHQFANRKIPVDAFIFDFEWYTTFPDYEVKPEGVDGFSDFGWNAGLLPAPAEQIKQLHDAGVRFVGIRKPRLGNSETLKMIRAKGWGFQSKSKVDTRGLWFADEKARHWYADQLKPLLKAGIDGWWNDEGEFTYTNYLYWDMAQREALAAVNPTARLWTLNRAFQPGAARLGAAAWTGDIHATWRAFEKTPTALLNWSLAGMPYGCCDIGGYARETNPELLTRWMQAGTFFPVMRTHSNLKATPHFPWLFGADAERAMKKAIELRYRLVPMLYSLAHQTHATGEPIIRPLTMEFPLDPAVADLSDEWLLGRGLLVAPMLKPGNRRSVYWPADTWYDWNTGAKLVGPKTLDLTVPLDQMPIYVRAGTILPLGPIVQHTRDLPGGTLELRIYAGRNARFTLFEDDGETTAYLHGAVRQTLFTWNDAKRELTWSRSGDYAGKDVFQSMRILLQDDQTQLAPQQPLTKTGHVIFKP